MAQGSEGCRMSEHRDAHRHQQEESGNELL